jgi:PPOX class probable FMN-dependent enzyme
MMSGMADRDWRVRTEARLREHIGDAAPITRTKVRPALDADLRRWIEASPYVCVGTVDREGRCDVSPRGDEPGFVRILDDRTLVVPERPGNRLADTLTNLLETPAIGMLFLVPGCPETLRVNGVAEIHDGPPELLASLAARGRVPELAIVVRITDAYMHCGRAASRSRIWDPSMEWTSPRPDRLLAAMFGLDDVAAQELLDTYNADEL